ncbi:hypothetical protein [Thalassococcus sp. S3]|uniref:hypothetical protein n=1 Tax=Thalassococcus sp. S3 TaxID=2017482 RepID=UPI0010248605|nr:hypothetical protein [Thalassococcus sp. S3]QBF31487.1 hypothetical protein CFI11_09690 [Thalassococcus sp. S3]
MTAWYDTGSVDVTNGSTTVTGTGTAFVANVQPGEEFRLSGGQVGYEIIAVVSDTEITIKPAYLGSTQAAQDYVIVPVRGYPKRAYDALVSALATINGYINGALSGIFDPGDVGEPGISFSGDLNTGFFQPDANEIGMATAGVQRARLNGSGLTLDVPLRGTAVQDDELDETADRLMRVGAFGVGASVAPEMADIDDFDAPSGLYRTTNDTQNIPSEFPINFGLLTVQRYGNTNVSQIWRANFGAGSPFTIERRIIDGVAESWSQLYGQSNILGSVSESGGTPTGALIERGNNANGRYARLADGTLICQQLFDTPATNHAWTFPSAFQAVTGGSLTLSWMGRRGGQPINVTEDNDLTTTGVTLNCWDKDGAPISAEIFMTAQGRWF